MTEEEFVRGIRKCWAYAQAMHVDELFSHPVPLEPSVEFREIALSQSAAYEEVYLKGLEGSDYNILLADFAFLQFGRTSGTSVRYAYYPNPFLGSSREAIGELAELRSYVDEDLITYDEFLHRVAELRFTQHPPLIRYENAEDQYVELQHPCSHLHVGHHADNRWPLRRVLSPQAFTLMVFKYYYRTFWDEAEELKLGAERFDLDEMMIRDKQDCRILPDGLFSARAARQFFTD